MTINKLNALIVEITVDTFGDEEQLVAFLRAIRDNIPVPCAAMVIGEPIQVTKFDYDGNARRGLTAACLAANGSKLPLRSNSFRMAASLNQGTVLDGHCPYSSSQTSCDSRRGMQAILDRLAGPRASSCRQVPAASLPDGSGTGPP